MMRCRGTKPRLMVKDAADRLVRVREGERLIGCRENCRRDQKTPGVCFFPGKKQIRIPVGCV